MAPRPASSLTYRVPLADQDSPYHATMVLLPSSESLVNSVS